MFIANQEQIGRLKLKLVQDLLSESFSAKSLLKVVQLISLSA